MMKKKTAETIEAMTKSKPRFLWGFTAGAVGGLAGAVAIVAMEQFSAPRGSEDARPQREAERWTADRTPLAGATGQRVHWVVGALAGGAYGMVAEVWPQVTEGNGAAFGLALEAATHEGSTAQGGFLSGPVMQGILARTGDVTTHAAYGMTAEFVRKRLRSWLESRDGKRRLEAKRSAQRNVNLNLPA